MWFTKFNYFKLITLFDLLFDFRSGNNTYFLACFYDERCMLQHYIVGIYVWHVICMCMLSHSITSIKKILGRMFRVFLIFSTLVNLIGLLWLLNPQSCPCWKSGPIRISLSLLGPKLLLGLYCNSLQFWPFLAQSKSNQKTFLFSGSSRSKTNFGPVLDFGLNHIEAQQPLENPNN